MEVGQASSNRKGVRNEDENVQSDEKNNKPERDLTYIRGSQTISKCRSVQQVP